MRNFSYLGSVPLFCCVLLGLVACSDKQAADADKPLDKTVRIGVVHCCDSKDVFMQNAFDSMVENTQKNPQVSLSISVSNDNQATQNQQIKELLSQNIQALVVSTVDTDPESRTGKTIIDMVKNAKVPVAFYNHGIGLKDLRTDPNAYYVGSIPAQSGLFQGELIAKNWEKHPEWDRNKDGIIQYVLLKGPNGHPDAEGRTKWVAATIENYPAKGIEAQQLYLGVANWQRSQAKDLVNQWLSESGDKIEMIVANNDDMAAGAIDALKEHNMRLPVFGVDGSSTALNMIKSGDMAGTVLQDGKGQALGAMQIAINLAAGRPVGTGVSEKVINNQVMIAYIGIDADNLSQYLK